MSENLREKGSKTLHKIVKIAKLIYATNIQEVENGKLLENCLYHEPDITFNS